MSTPIVRRRKKPVEVDTIQWTGTNEADVQAFTGTANFYALDEADRKNSDDPEATATVFDNLHNTWVLVYTGQHIVRGVRREYYPIAEDVLADTYEIVEEEATPTGATDTPDFFQRGHTYRLASRHTFRCTDVDTNPGTGEPHAIGWAYDTHTDRWRVTDLTGASWRGGWVDVTEAGDRHA